MNRNPFDISARYENNPSGFVTPYQMQGSNDLELLQSKYMELRKFSRGPVVRTGIPPAANKTGIAQKLVQVVASRGDPRRIALFAAESRLASAGRQKDITAGLIPIGDTGLYRTPDEPADPTDCTRYPDSPYCGGNPLSLMPIGFSPQIIFDNCNIGIRLNPVLGFIRLPPVAVVYRFPECRIQSNELTPEFNDSEPLIIPNSSPCGERSSIVIVYLESLIEHTLSKGTQTDVGEETIVQTVELEEFTYPYSGDKLSPYPIGMDLDIYPPASAYIKLKTHRLTTFNEVARQSRHRNIPANETGQYEVYQEKETEILPSDYFNIFYFKVNIDNTSQWDGQLFNNNYGGARNQLANNYANTKAAYNIGELTDPHFYYKEFEYKWKVIIRCGRPTPPPPPLETCCMPQCCEPTDNALLKLLLKKVEKLSQIVGVEEFPAKMPKRLVYPNAKGDVEIKSIIQALGYQVSQVDKAVGYLPQKIKVTDVNATEIGNQSVEVEIHSFADFARETLQYVIDTEGDEDTLTNIAVRILYECGAIHQAVVQGDAMLDCIVEYLDFKEKWKSVKVPFAFDPYAGQKGKKAGQGFAKDKDTNKKSIPLTEEELEKLLPALLKETEVEIRILENEQKRSMNDVLQEILRDARIAAAAVSDDAKGSRLEELVNAAQAILQLQNATSRNNVRKALTSGDLRTRKKAKP